MYLPPHTAFFHEYCAVTKLFVGNLPFTATDETDFDGRSLKVNEAQERERFGGGNRNGGSRRY